MMGPGHAFDVITGEHGFGRFQRKRAEPAVDLRLRRLARPRKQI